MDDVIAIRSLGDEDIVDYEVRQAQLNTGEFVTVLVLYRGGTVMATLWHDGMASQLAEDLLEVDACTEAGVVIQVAKTGAGADAVVGATDGSNGSQAGT